MQKNSNANIRQNFLYTVFDKSVFQPICIAHICEQLRLVDLCKYLSHEFSWKFQKKNLIAITYVLKDFFRNI